MKVLMTYFFFCGLVFISEGIRFDRRTFLELGCRGSFTRSSLAHLDRICEECYELFKEPRIQISCRSNCFKNDLFNMCVGSLLLQEQEEQLQTMVNDMHSSEK